MENGIEYIKASIADPLDVKRTTGRYWGYDVRVARSVEGAVLARDRSADTI